MGQINSTEFISWLNRLKKEENIEVSTQGDNDLISFKIRSRYGVISGEVGDKIDVFSIRFNMYYSAHEVAYSSEDRNALLLEARELCKSLIGGSYTEREYIHKDQVLKKEIAVQNSNKYLILEARKITLKSRILLMLRKFTIRQIPGKSEK